jgi:heme exporter protein D
MGVTIALTVSTRLADFAWLAFAQGFILLIFLAIAQMLTKTILVTVTYLRRPRAVDDEESLGDIR